MVLALPDGNLWAIEVKRSLSPKVERGFHAAFEDLQPAQRWVVYPGTERYPVAHGIHATPLAALCIALSNWPQAH